MFLCDCKFSTDSLRSLRSHYAANHGSGISFFKKFDDVIISNWEDFPLRTIRLFLLWKSNYECTSCGYDKARECGTSILEVDHIDGNHDNNTFRNLRVLCPNCHALTPKYRNWSNKGNKKRTSSLRPGNTDYDERHKKYEEKRIERQLEIEKKKALRDELRPDKNKTFREFEKIKINFREKFIQNVNELHRSKEIDFSKYGWVQILAERCNEHPQVVGKRVRSLMPDFYIEHCFSRRYNHYIKNMESIRLDEEAVLKTVAG
jgi:hypothetical protein